MIYREIKKSGIEATNWAWIDLAMWKKIGVIALALLIYSLVLYTISKRCPELWESWMSEENFGAFIAAQILFLAAVFMLVLAEHWAPRYLIPFVASIAVFFLLFGATEMTEIVSDKMVQENVESVTNPKGQIVKTDETRKPAAEVQPITRDTVFFVYLSFGEDTLIRIPEGCRIAYCGSVEPFEVRADDVGEWIPISPTTARGTAPMVHLPQLQSVRLKPGKYMAYAPIKVSIVRMN